MEVPVRKFTCLDGNSPGSLLIELESLAEVVAHGEGTGMKYDHWQQQAHALSPAKSTQHQLVLVSKPFC